MIKYFKKKKKRKKNWEWVIWPQDKILKRPKRGSCEAKKDQDKMKGINEDHWEDDEHDKGFSARVNNRRCEKLFQCLNLKCCILGKIS